MEILSVVALVISIISCGITLYTFFWTARRDRKQATLDAFNKLQTEAFDKLNQYKLAEILEISKHPQSKEYNEVGVLIARIEHFCVGVNTHIYDRKTVFLLAHGYLDSNKLLSRIEPIIDKKKQKPQIRLL